MYLSRTNDPKKRHDGKFFFLLLRIVIIMNMNFLPKMEDRLGLN